MRLTFRKSEFDWFVPETHYISFNGVVVGHLIKGESWKIRCQTNKNAEELKESPNCTWRWFQFRKGFETAKQAKEWIKCNKKFFEDFICDDLKKEIKGE